MTEYVHIDNKLHRFDKGIEGYEKYINIFKINKYK